MAGTPASRKRGAAANPPAPTTVRRQLLHRDLGTCRAIFELHPAHILSDSTLCRLLARYKWRGHCAACAACWRARSNRGPKLPSGCVERHWWYLAAAEGESKSCTRDLTCATQHYTTQHPALRNPALRSSAPSTAQPSTTQPSTAQLSTQHCATQHCAAQHPAPSTSLTLYCSATHTARVHVSKIDRAAIFDRRQQRAAAARCQPMQVWSLCSCGPQVACTTTTTLQCNTGAGPYRRWRADVPSPDRLGTTPPAAVTIQ